MIFTSHLFVVPLFLSGGCEESRGRGFVRFSSLRQTRLVGAQHEPCVYTRTNAYRVRIRTLFRWWMSHRLPNIPTSLDRRRVMFPPHLWPTSRGKISRRTENWHRFFCLVFSILFFIFLYISSHILFRAIHLFSRAPGDGDRPAPHWSFAVDGVRLALLLSLSRCFWRCKDVFLLSSFQKISAMLSRDGSIQLCSLVVLSAFTRDPARCLRVFILAPEFGHCQCTTDGAPMFSDMCFDSGASVHDRSRRLFPRHSLARVCPTDQLSSYNTMYCRRLALSVSRPFSFCFVLRRRSARRGGGDNENDDSSSSPSGHI